MLKIEKRVGNFSATKKNLTHGICMALYNFLYNSLHSKIDAMRISANLDEIIFTFFPRKPPFWKNIAKKW